MTDREKLVEIVCNAIQEVDCISHCNHPPCYKVHHVVDELIAHGVTIKEPQKPLTLEELRRIEWQPVWCETEETRKPCVVKCSLIDKEDAIFYALGSEYPIFFSVETYGQIWRCWAEKPTEEERKAAEW